MSIIQSPFMTPNAPAGAPAAAPSNSEDAGAGKESGFAEVLRGKQNPPRREPQGEHRRPALPDAESDTDTTEAAVPGVDVSTLPPELAAALAQIGAAQSGTARHAAQPRQGQDAASGLPVGDAAGGRANPSCVSGATVDGLGVRAPAAAAANAAATATANALDARQPIALEPEAQGARLARADGVVARASAASPAPQADPAPALRFESMLERAGRDNGRPGQAAGGVEASPTASAALPGWAASAIPVDQSAARAPAVPQHVATVDAPVGSQRFTDQAAQQVTWMARNGITEAEIRVKPAELGPITVHIEMNQGEAVINFAVTQPETRAAVQDSLHRLQEMLAESGISLGEANVGDQGQARQFGDGAPGGGSRSRVTFAAGGSDAIGALSAPARAAPSARSLVDTFA